VVETLALVEDVVAEILVSVAILQQVVVGECGAVLLADLFLLPELLARNVADRIPILLVSPLALVAELIL
jgi:hypothetical protein